MGWGSEKPAAHTQQNLTQVTPWVCDDATSFQFAGAQPNLKVFQRPIFVRKSNHRKGTRTQYHYLFHEVVSVNLLVQAFFLWYNLLAYIDIHFQSEIYENIDLGRSLNI